MFGHDGSNDKRASFSAMAGFLGKCLEKRKEDQSGVDVLVDIDGRELEIKVPLLANKMREKWDTQQLRGRGRKAPLYWPAGFSAGLAEGLLVSAIAALGFQKSGSALIQSSEA